MTKISSPWSVINILALGVIFLVNGCSDSLVGNERLPTITEGKALRTALHTPTASTSIITHSPFTKTTTPTVTPTMRLTFTPTVTKVPTLQPTLAAQALLALFANNGNCQLPCWWGIVPGQTSWQEVRNRLSPIGKLIVTSSGDFERYDYSFYAPKGVDPAGWGYFEVDLWLKDGIVSFIFLSLSFVQENIDYSLSGILTTFGEPEEIWISLLPESPRHPYYYYGITLFYPSKGVSVSYTRDAVSNSHVFTLCPQEFRPARPLPYVELWSPSTKVDFFEIREKLQGGLVNELPEGYFLMRDLTDQFDEGDFYQTYIQRHTRTCIKILKAKLLALWELP